MPDFPRRDDIERSLERFRNFVPQHDPAARKRYNDRMLLPILRESLGKFLSCVASVGKHSIHSAARPRLLNRAPSRRTVLCVLCFQCTSSCLISSCASSSAATAVSPSATARKYFPAAVKFISAEYTFPLR